MKKLNILISTLISLLVLGTNITFAQVASGPSDAVSSPPATTADAGKIICYGSGISISGPQDVGGVDYAKYHWFKIAPDGSSHEATSITGRTYTEASGATGYYNYQLITENANGCTSPISDVFKIFVLPQLIVSITTPTTSMCAIAASASLLTANVTPATGYVVNYQWTRNGVAIPGATASTYNATGETSPATVTFGVTVTYALNPSCSTTATQDIILTPLPTKPLITAN